MQRTSLWVIILIPNTNLLNLPKKLSLSHHLHHHISKHRQIQPINFTSLCTGNHRWLLGWIKKIQLGMWGRQESERKIFHFWSWYVSFCFVALPHQRSLNLTHQIFSLIFKICSIDIIYLEFKDSIGKILSPGV